MFKRIIYGEIDGQVVKVVLGSKYFISINQGYFDGTIFGEILECNNDGFLVRHELQEIVIRYDSIVNIELVGGLR